jgi:hypothetical protein
MQFAPGGIAVNAEPDTVATAVTVVNVAAAGVVAPIGPGDAKFIGGPGFTNALPFPVRVVFVVVLK